MLEHRLVIASHDTPITGAGPDTLFCLSPAITSALWSHPVVSDIDLRRPAPVIAACRLRWPP